MSAYILKFRVRPTNVIILSTEGNLVNALDGANPTRLLLHALQNYPAAPSFENQNIPKELRVYIGTLNQRNGTYEVPH